MDYNPLAQNDPARRYFAGPILFFAHLLRHLLRQCLVRFERFAFQRSLALETLPDSLQQSLNNLNPFVIRQRDPFLV